MSTKNLPMFSKYAYRNAPKDIDWHFIINEVAYVEKMMENLELAYDDDENATISLLARYYRNYKGLDKAVCDDLIYKYIDRYYEEKSVIGIAGRCGSIVKNISRATSCAHYANNHGRKPLRDFDGVSITQNEIDYIKQFESLEEQEVAFTCLCFTKMYNETNKRQGRKINNLFYVDATVLRRCMGWKRGTQDKVDDVYRDLVDKQAFGWIENRDKYEAIIGKTTQPFMTRQCNFVDD